MQRRDVLRGAATGVVASLAGCSTRETVVSSDAAPEIAEEEFYHERHDLSQFQQVNLSYTVAASSGFDVFVFGGMSDPEVYDDYRQAVREGTDATLSYNERNSTLGADGEAESSRPFNGGILHFVVDNTDLGEAAPTGPLTPSIELRVGNFSLF